MQYSIILTVLFAALVSCKFEPLCSSSQSSRCYTSMSSSKCGKPTTKHETSTITHTKTTTVIDGTKTVTTTKAGSTATSTAHTTSVVTTTASTVSDTATITQTSTETDTITAAPVTSTISATTTTTSTSTVYILTIPTPDGFEPIQTSLPGSTDPDLAIMKREAEVVERNPVPAERESFSRRGSVLPRNVLLRSNKEGYGYPGNVDCVTYTSVTKTKTIHSTSTVTKTTTAGATTVTTTQTCTSTSTVFPSHVTSTSTVTSTATSLTTTTPTTTSTTTSTVTSSTTVLGDPVATAFAQCEANNYASRGNNGGLLNDLLCNESQTMTVASNNPLDCCIACAMNPICEVSQYDPMPFGSESGPVCILTVPAYGMCSSTAPQQCTVARTNAVDHATDYINGNCGQVSMYFV